MGQDPMEAIKPSAENIGGLAAATVPFELPGMVGAYHDYLQKREATKAGVLTEARAQSPEVPAALPMSEVEQPKAIDVAKLPPDEFVKWKQDVKYGPETHKQLAQGLTAEDKTFLTQERDRLRLEGSKAMQGATPETMEKVWAEQGPLSAKAQTLHEILTSAEELPKPKLDPISVDSVHEAEDRYTLQGLPPDEVAQRTANAAQRMSEVVDRKPGEPWDKYLYRQLGVDPKIDLANDPQTFLSSSRQLWQKFGHYMGMPQDESARLEPWFLKFASTIGKGLGETWVLEVDPTITESGKTTQGFFATSRGDVPNAFIGMTQVPKGQEGKIGRA